MPTDAPMHTLSVTDRHRRTHRPPPGPDHRTDHDPHWAEDDVIIGMTTAQTHHEHAVTQTQAARGRTRGK